MSKQWSKSTDIEAEARRTTPDGRWVSAESVARCSCGESIRLGIDDSDAESCRWIRRHISRYPPSRLCGRVVCVEETPAPKDQP